MKIHFSSTDCFEQCPMKYYFRYIEHLKTLEAYEPDNALVLGTALHKGIETDTETAIHDYFFSYPVIDQAHINEAIKLEYWIPKVKELLPKGLHEVNMKNDWYEGTMDLIVPCTKHDMNLKHGQFDLYDFKYSNNVSHYMESRQLHVYKYMFEKITGKKIRKQYFVFVPKVKLKQGFEEPDLEYRTKLYKELSSKKVEIKEVPYNPQKVCDFFETIMNIQNTSSFIKNETFLCNWCEYKDFCKKGENHMLLPSEERRQVGKTTKRKIWIYGSAFSGKTTFVDSAPDPLNLNTDGNIQFVTMPFIPIKDTYEGRQKVFAWEVFKDAIAELEKKDNNFKTLVVDLLEDTYELCRLYEFDKQGFSHESDAGYGKGWDIVRTEFLSTIRRLVNLDYENIILISHEDSSKDITKKSGDKITSIKPNIGDKIANKIAGMVDIVARVVVEDDGTRTLNFKSNEVIFGGGRLKGIRETTIPLDWNALVDLYDSLNMDADKPKKAKKKETVKEEEKPSETKENAVSDDASEAESAPAPEPEKEPEEESPRRRTRKKRPKKCYIST